MNRLETILTLGDDTLSAFGSGGGWQQFLLPLGVILVMLSIFTSLRKRRKRMTTRLDPREELERVRQRDAVRDDLRTLMVEVEQLAKRMGAQLDAKAIRLERLIDEADRKLAELETAGRSDAADAEHPAAAREAARDSAPPPPPGRERAAADSSPARSAAAASTTTEREPADALAASVYRLSDTGMDAMQIARKLGEHVGKVELIMALRRV